MKLIKYQQLVLIKHIQPKIIDYNLAFCPA